MRRIYFLETNVVKKKNEKGQLIVKNQIWDSSYFRELHKGLYS